MSTGNKNYYDFAENDYLFIKAAYKEGGVWNSMCSIAQKVCERFLKHLIEQYYVPDTKEKVDETGSVMRAHNLNKIERFIKENTDIVIDPDTHKAIRDVNGFYYETSYPGDESYFVTKEDIDIAVAAMETCKVFTDRIIAERNQQRGEGGSDGDQDLPDQEIFAPSFPGDDD